MNPSYLISNQSSHRPFLVVTMFVQFYGFHFCLSGLSLLDRWSDMVKTVIPTQLAFFWSVKLITLHYYAIGRVSVVTYTYTCTCICTCPLCLVINTCSIRTNMVDVVAGTIKKNFVHLTTDTSFYSIVLCVFFSVSVEVVIKSNLFVFIWFCLLSFKLNNKLIYCYCLLSHPFFEPIDVIVVA